MSEWLDLMLDEIARKKREEDEAAEEQKRRDEAATGRGGREIATKDAC